MLRLAVIVLLLANAGYYAWSQGLLKDWGFAPEEQAEPQRMNQQIRPETLQILRVNPSRNAPPTSSQAAPAGAAVDVRNFDGFMLRGYPAVHSALSRADGALAGPAEAGSGREG